MPSMLTPSAICRMRPADLLSDNHERGSERVTLGALLTIVIGTLAYGFAFGLWRAPEQGLYSAVKMPVLFLAIVATTTVINTMLAQLMGVPVRMCQTLEAMLYAMAITSAILGAFSPVGVFLVLQLPPPIPNALDKPASHPDVQASMAIFWPLLLGHITVIAAAGVTGCLRLHSALKAIARTPIMASRLLAIWIVVTGFVGGELSWLLSPFLCKPNFPPHLVTRTYHEGNFYEHVYRALRAL
jgi:hypothetical protein